MSASPGASFTTAPAVVAQPHALARRGRSRPGPAGTARRPCRRGRPGRGRRRSGAYGAASSRAAPSSWAWAGDAGVARARIAIRTARAGPRSGAGTGAASITRDPRRQGRCRLRPPRNPSITPTFPPNRSGSMSTAEIPVDNGVNVEALLGVRDALADTPDIAQFQWRATPPGSAARTASRTSSRSTALGDEQQHKASFTYDADHPLAVRGRGQRRHAGRVRARGARQLPHRRRRRDRPAAQDQAERSVSATIEAEMDLHGILGADPDVRTASARST